MILPVFTPLVPSEPAFLDAGVPYSPRYGDVYHALQGGVAQAREVFLRGNGLPERWRGRERFTVCETGFGLGLSFLALWRAWRDDPARPGRLHVVSVEAHPFARGHLAELLRDQAPVEWRDMVEQMLAQWPPLLPGLHRLDLDGGAVTLTLAFGLAESVVPQLTASVDAFFLDGFSPARNPEMWSEPLLRALARLAAPGATAATWASAGAVRRTLQAVGFEVEKLPGFGGKTHRIEARYAPRFERRHQPAPAPRFARKRALVVGAGIAGASVAHALALRGWEVAVWEACPPEAMPGQGHAAAALTPLLARDDAPRARLTRAGALRAQARWTRWMDGDVVACCGTVQMARSTAKEEEMQAMTAELGFPADWVRAAGQAEASGLAGLPLARGGLFFAQGLRVRPRALCARLLAQPGITVHQARVARIEGEPSDVPGGRRWRLFDEAGGLLDAAEALVVANAGGAPALLRASPLPDEAFAGKFFQQKGVAGQISLLPSSDAGWREPPRCIVAGEGYVLPPLARPDGSSVCVTGSTYVHDASEARETAEGHAANLRRAALLLPDLAASTLDAGALRGWAGWRAVAPGRLPVIAELPGMPHAWVAAAYASRGLTWSALAGDLIAASLEGEPLMLERDLLRAMGWR